MNMILKVCLIVSLLMAPSYAESLKVGSSLDYPPFEFYQDGKVVGYDIELIHEIAKRLGKTAEIIDMSFDTLIAGLQTNRVHLVISSLSPTDERKKAVDFSTIYHQATFALVCLAKQPVPTLKDRENKKVGLQLGTIYEHYLKESLTEEPELLKTIEVNALTKIPDLIQNLKSNRIAAVLMGYEEAKATVQQHPELQFFELAPLQKSNTSCAGSAIAFPKNSPLTAEVNRILAEMKADGTLAVLEKKWLRS